MKILIKVTKDILQRSMMCGVDSIAKNCAINCAIAVAVREIFPQASVGLNTIAPISKEEGLERISLPITAVSFISTFDSLYHTPAKRLELPEFSFEIDVPYSILEKVGISEVYKILSESKTLECVSI